MVSGPTCDSSRYTPKLGLYSGKELNATKGIEIQVVTQGGLFRNCPGLSTRHFGYHVNQVSGPGGWGSSRPWLP